MAFSAKLFCQFLDEVYEYMTIDTFKATVRLNESSYLLDIVQARDVYGGMRISISGQDSGFVQFIDDQHNEIGMSVDAIMPLLRIPQSSYKIENAEYFFRKGKSIHFCKNPTDGDYYNVYYNVRSESPSQTSSTKLGTVDKIDEGIAVEFMVKAKEKNKKKKLDNKPATMIYMVAGYYLTYTFNLNGLDWDYYLMKDDEAAILQRGTTKEPGVDHASGVIGEFEPL